MKVLHFYKTYFPDTLGGVERVINQIALGTSPLGVEMEVLSLSPTATEPTLEFDGHKAHRCRSNFELASTPFSVSVFSRFRQLAKQADIIHYHFPYPFADVLHFTKGIKKPTVITYHSDIVHQKYLFKLYHPLMNRFLSDVDRIVATSPNYLETSPVLSRFKDKTSVIPIGIKKTSYPVAKPEINAKWRQQFGPRFFFFVGMLRYYKGLHILIEAARNSTYPIVISGEGPVEEELKMLVAKLKVSNIHFTGNISEEDKVSLINLCTAFVFPSHLRSEAFGVSLLEGAMYGKPLISAEIGTGTSFVNIDQETGLVVAPSNPAALRRAMDYIWNNPEEVMAMGINAEKRYNSLFTATQMSQSYYELYQSLVD